MSETRNASNRQGGTLRTLLVACGLAAGFLIWGLFVFRTVGDKGPPVWDYGAVPDVPGLSAFSTDSARPLPNVPPYFLHEQAGLSPQHVKERPYILESKPLPAPEILPQTPKSQGKEPSP
jgi:hypothetical protein